MVSLRGVFFSSRRRHTRYWRDWSSDVCSSDLGRQAGVDLDVAQRIVEALHMLAQAEGLAVEGPGHVEHGIAVFEAAVPERSEERRVGKECRSRWSPYH